MVGLVCGFTVGFAHEFVGVLVVDLVSLKMNAKTYRTRVRVF